MSNHSEIQRVMFEAGEAACVVLRRHFGKIASVQTKSGETDIVTIADQQAEAAILRRIRRAFPGHAILAEESGGEARIGEAEFCWVIDPLDGTTNFAHGMPLFAVSIGVLREGKPWMGLIVDVTRDEWHSARRGAGAFVGRRRADGTWTRRRLHVTTKRRLAESLLITGFPHDRRRNLRHLMDILEVTLARTRGVLRIGSAALDLVSVAAGQVEGFWEEHLAPWDVAAGLLLVEEAGGRVTNLAGKRSGVFDDSFVASNGAIHREMLATLREAWREW